MEFVHRLMQGYYPIKDIPPLNDGHLRRSHNLISDGVKPKSCGFCENLKANVKKADRAILMYHFRFNNFWQ
jgi:hypothetical protein